MAMPSEWPVWRAAVLVPLLLLLPPAAAQVTPEKQARIDALRQQVADLEQQERDILARVRDVGGAKTTGQGITLARATKAQADHQHAQVQAIVDSYRQNVADLEQMQRQVESDMDRRIEEANQGLTEQAQDKALVYAGGKALSHLLATEAGPLLDIGIKVVDQAGRAVVEEINEDQLREQIHTEQGNLRKALEVMVLLAEQSSAETVRIRELENLQQQSRDNFDALAETRRRLDFLLTRNIHDDANLERVTDPAGDATERLLAGVKLCDPSQAHKPRGVGPARHKKADSAKEMPEEKTEKVAAEDDACLDITGFWTFTTSIQAYDRKVSTPPVQAEITAAEGGDEFGYEFFPASKAKAPTGPIMKCSPSGQALTCQRRVQPQACPEEKYVWQPLDLTVAADGSSITGEFRQTLTPDMTADPSGCTLVPFEGQGNMTYTFVPAEASPTVK